MFRYTKGEGKEVWRLIENSDKAIRSSVATGAHFVTVLSVDQDVDKLDDDAKISYKGPFYLDIDSDDETKSLTDCRRALLSLYKDYGVSLKDCIIHVSGSKGFHILVPAKVFSNGKSQPFLAYTYKKMALEFNLECLDYGIYSCGKGRMWRVENVKRSNDRYKVRLSAAQVFALTWDEIEALSYVPGLETPFDINKDVEYAAELAALFRRSEHKPSKMPMVEDAKLKALPGDPGCIKKLLKNVDVVQGRRFNQLIMTLCQYAKGRGWNLKELEANCSHLIENAYSSAYPKERDKRRHIRAIFHYVNSSDSYQFSCIIMRKNIQCEQDCCPACPIQQAEIETDYDATLGIESAHNCYFRRTDSGRNQITTFIIRPHSVIEFIDSGDNKEYTIFTEIVADNGHKTNVIFTQPDWGSKSALIKRLPHPDFAYLGGDTDVQRVFKVITQIDVPKKLGVKVIGLHKAAGKWHYVSQEGSLGPDNELNQLLLETDYYLPNTLISETVPTVPELDDILKYLFSYNAIEITVPMVGWFVAAMYKERIFELTKQFPLLFIFGQAGAGKTQTILNLKRIFCLSIENIKSIADVTSFTLIKSANGNNTIPLMLDEYKATTFNQFQVKMVSKLIRAAYNNEIGERGTASQEIRTYHYRSPIILAGEQTVTEPAARDRIIEVHMSKEASAPHLAGFKKLQGTALPKLGKLLLTDALRITNEELQAMLDSATEEVPECYTDRPRLNQSVIRLGLRLLQRVVSPSGFGAVIDEAISNYTDKRSAIVDDDIAENRKSDIDRIMEAISLMSDTDERYKLAPEWDYVIDGDRFSINLRVVYARYLKFAEEYKSDAEAMNFTTFLKLLKKEPYFIKDNAPIKLKQGTKLCTVLHLPRLTSRGLNLSGLIETKEKHAEDEVFKL